MLKTGKQILGSLCIFLIYSGFYRLIHHLFVPAHQTSPEELETKFLSTQWLQANTEHDSKMQEVMRQTEGTHQGDNLGVGKGVSFKGWEKPTLDGGREKKLQLESF